MVCSNCKQEGHNKSKCKNPTYVAPAVEESEEPFLIIPLPTDIMQKLYTLKGHCIEVARELGKGYIEFIYQQGLCLELQAAGIRYVAEETMPILYKGQPVGGGHSQRLDVVLLNYLPFIYELKSTPKMTSANHWQLVRYMVYKSLTYGAVVNFNQSDKGPLEIQFIVLYEGKHYLFDLDTKIGTELVDYRLRQLENRVVDDLEEDE